MLIDKNFLLKEDRRGESERDFAGEEDPRSPRGGDQEKIVGKTS